MKFPAKFKGQCIACGAIAPKMNKEHFWPQWLIRRTKTHLTGVRFDQSKLVNPKKLTIPLCLACNADFGRELEEPASRIIDDLESGRGISDQEAEILVRWLWKFEGFAWLIQHPHGRYSERYTLRERVLQPLDDIRENLTLGISLARTIDPEFGDAPMGLDSHTRESAVFVSGVFSRVAVMVLLRQFEGQVPSNFSLYRLAPAHALDRSAKLFFPRVGFETCTEAVATTWKSSLFLAYLHDTRTRRLTHPSRGRHKGYALAPPLMSNVERLRSASKDLECSVAIKNILFDADGVLQHATQHWQPALQAVLGLKDESQARAVLADVFAAETEVLESGGGFAERLEAVLAKWERPGFLLEALKVIHAIEVNQDVMQTVQAIRRSGIRCHIASNQQTSRAKHMSEGLNYRSLFDTEFYSCFIGAAKPKISYFEKVVVRLGCDASAVLFLDDRAENVDAARKAGLNAMVFFGADGSAALKRQLAGFGVSVGS